MIIVKVVLDLYNNNSKKFVKFRQLFKNIFIVLQISTHYMLRGRQDRSKCYYFILNTSNSDIIQVRYN